MALGDDVHVPRAVLVGDPVPLQRDEPSRHPRARVRGVAKAHDVPALERERPRGGSVEHDPGSRAVGRGPRGRARGTRRACAGRHLRIGIEGERPVAPGRSAASTTATVATQSFTVTITGAASAKSRRRRSIAPARAAGRARESGKRRDDWREHVDRAGTTSNASSMTRDDSASAAAASRVVDGACTASAPALARALEGARDIFGRSPRS